MLVPPQLKASRKYNSDVVIEMLKKNKKNKSRPVVGNSFSKLASKHSSLQFTAIPLHTLHICTLLLHKLIKKHDTKMQVIHVA